MLCFSVNRLQVPNEEGPRYQKKSPPPSPSHGSDDDTEVNVQTKVFGKKDIQLNFQLKTQSGFFRMTTYQSGTSCS